VSAKSGRLLISGIDPRYLLGQGGLFLLFGSGRPVLCSSLKTAPGAQIRRRLNAANKDNRSTTVFFHYEQFFAQVSSVHSDNRGRGVSHCLAILTARFWT
jgi:hypothetical protein